MTQNASVWLLLVVAVCCANLPYVNSRLFGVLRLPGGKSLAVRLAELLVYYFLVGGLGLLLERHAGQIAAQGWEFYANTATLFLTLAFPGFVYRYLLKHRS